MNNHKTTNVKIKRLAKTQLPTEHGKFDMYAYESPYDLFPHVALVSGKLKEHKIPYVRIHSECMTGDVLGSIRCDCREQLLTSLKKIGSEGGVLIYMRQEGRGIGLVNKMHAYNLQNQGLNTLEANLKLGFHQDLRTYDEAIAILRDIKLKDIMLITNNPEKIKSFDNSGIRIVKRVPIEVVPRNENINYLKTKKEEMGHLLAI